MGVDGGIDAVIKLLYVLMRDDQLPDFVLPLSVVEQKSRVVYEERALLQELALSESAAEFKMRERVSLRAFLAMWDKRILFNPSFSGVFSLQFISHKLLRYLAFIPLVIVLICSLLLVGDGSVYLVALLLLLLFYCGAFYAHRHNEHNYRVLGLCYYF